MATYNRTVQDDGTIDFHHMNFKFHKSEDYIGKSCTLEFVDKPGFLGFDVLIDNNFVGFATKH